jgi:multiple sugar transport system permease protein
MGSRLSQKGAAPLGILFVLPAVVLIVFCGAIPIVNGIRYSLTSWDGVAPPRFIGLANYEEALLHDPVHRRALLNTLVLSVSCLALQLVLGYAAANLLFQLRGFMAEAGKVVLFMPYILSFAAVGVLFSFVFGTSDLGLLNKVIGLFGARPFPWLGSEYTAMPAVIFTYAWKDFGFAMILYYAGLQSIPSSLLEAGEIDGANAGQLTRWIKLPMLRSVTQTVAVLAVIHYMLTFTIIYFLTPNGGPNRATEVAATWFYKQSFQFMEFGYGAALAVIMAVLVLALTLGLRRAIRSVPS